MDDILDIKKFQNILEKNGIKESLDDAFKKTDDGQISLIVELGKIADNFTSGDISEKDLEDVIQKNLKIAKDISGKISVDIKNEISSTATKNASLDNQAKKTPPLTPKIKPTTNKNIPKKQNGTKEPDTYREPIE